MNKKRTTTKTLAILALLVALLLPMRSVAQYRDERYGLQPWFGQQSLMNREGSGGTNNGITNQTYGSDQDAWGISNQTYGEQAPLGSGLLIMAAAAMGYAGMKRNKKQTNKKARQ